MSYTPALLGFKMLLSGLHQSSRKSKPWRCLVTPACCKEGRRRKTRAFPRQIEHHSPSVLPLQRNQAAPRGCFSFREGVLAPGEVSTVSVAPPCHAGEAGPVQGPWCLWRAGAHLEGRSPWLQRPNWNIFCSTSHVGHLRFKNGLKKGQLQKP